jgi:hypothetical protein
MTHRQLRRDDRVWLGRQRFSIAQAKTWVAGPSPAMTQIKACPQRQQNDLFSIRRLY